MLPFIRIFLALATVLSIGIPASARNEQGLLDVIQTPNDGMPALALPGDSFDVVARAKAELSLNAGDASIPLDAQWTDLPGDRMKAQCRVPENAAPGAYALHATVGERTDVSLRSVFVMAEFPERYTIAHVTDTHIGSNRNARTSEDIFRDVITAVNASGAAFALITGDLTENGEADQFARFIEILNTCALPTFVCSGNHDRKDLNYENAFGPDAYMFRFGRDGYIGFDTKDFAVADDLRAQPADLQVFRRAIKPSRWAIGFSHRYEADMGMRAQIALFIDDPLDWFIFGHWHRANTEAEKSVPWAGVRHATPITVTPAAINGAMRLFEIGPSGIRPGEVQIVAQTKQGVS
jgi:predicted phosphodiesterase